MIDRKVLDAELDTGLASAKHDLVRLGSRIGSVGEKDRGELKAFRAELQERRHVASQYLAHPEASLDWETVESLLEEGDNVASSYMAAHAQLMSRIEPLAKEMSHANARDA